MRSSLSVVVPTFELSAMWRSSSRKKVITMAKPSKAALTKAGKTLASGGSSKTAKSKAGTALGKG